MKKFLILNLISILVISSLTGCGTGKIIEDKTEDKITEIEDKGKEIGKDKETDKETDAVTTASIVNNETAFLKAVSKDGTWIIATLNDLTIDQEIVLEGDFTNKEQPARKIALYAQDADRNKTASFTLKAPRLIVRSENTKIQGGTFIGDVYVEAKGFTVTDAKIEGNVYFASEEFKSTFDSSKEGVITGVTEVEK